MSEDTGLSRRLFLAGLAALPFAGCAQPPHPLQNDYARMLELHKQGKYAEAIGILDKLIEAEPGNAGLYNDRGSLRAARGEWGHALRDYDLSIALDPNAVRPYLSRGKVYRILANAWQPADAEKAKEYRGKAIKNFEAATAIDQSAPRPYLQLGLAYDENGEAQKAYETLDKALKMLREKPAAREHLDPGLEERCRERYEQLVKDRQA